MKTGQSIDEQSKALIETAADFHGHLGPYLVIGVRMGLLAKQVLNSDGSSGLSATVNTGSKPPLSCVADGIQVATGCTLGKGNIKIRALNEISSTFRTKQRAIQVKTKAEAIDSLKLDELRGSQKIMEKVATKVSQMLDSQLFNIEEL
ncbi:MAG: formylmethanofuran dehydrogenase subunit E family protein [Candidatus Bathyarchaeota archaeon]|nr:MAG: formylmethanofuran dehydrogenase subunit E family protein [Candidatus Bathyarchaeota archaeon]